MSRPGQQIRRIPGDPIGGDGAPRAAVAGDFIFTAGLTAATSAAGLPAEVFPHRGMPFHGSQSAREVKVLFQSLQSLLDESGANLGQILTVNAFHTDPTQIDPALRERQSAFGNHPLPASTLTLVSELPVTGATVMMDCIALSRAASAPIAHNLQASNDAPLPAAGQIYGKPVFSQFVRGGGLIFTQGKGIVGVEAFPSAAFPYQRWPAYAQTCAVLDYLGALLARAGATLRDSVRAEVYVRDGTDIAGVEQAWLEYFPEDPPARVFIPAALAVAPQVAVEINLICIDPVGPFKREVIATEEAPRPIGHEPQAVRAGPFLFFSGLYGVDSSQALATSNQTSAALPPYRSAAQAQAAYVLSNVDAIARAAATSSRNLVRRRCYYRDFRDDAPAESIWHRQLRGCLPPTTRFRSHAPLAFPEALVQYDLIAFIEDTELERSTA